MLLFLAFLVCAGAIASAPRRGPGRPGPPRSPRAPRRAAHLKDCCTPGDEDFPKVGGNLGNQNYSALRQINKSAHSPARRRLGQPHRRRHHHRHQPEHAGGGRRGHLHRIGARQRGRRGRQDRRHEVEVHADARQPDPPRRGRGPGSRLHACPATTTSSRSTRTPARSSGSGSTKASATSRRSRVVYYDGKLLVGTNDGDRGAALALDATTGDLLWHFWGAPGPGEFGNDTWEGDTWQEGGADAVDPSGDRSGPRHWSTGRSATCAPAPRRTARRAAATTCSPTRSSRSTSKTGEYKWHFQSIHHDIWDMDNVMAPVLVDARIRGRERKLVVYGSKSGMYFILDRRDGSAPLGIDEVPVPQEPRQKTWPTQPFPRQGGWTENCVVDQPLGTSVPGNPNRAVPNYERGCLYARALGRADPVDPRPRRRRGLEPSVVQPQHRPGLHRLRLRRRRALAHRVQQRPAPAGRVPDRRHRRGRSRAPTASAGRSACRTRSRTATAS